MAAKKPAAKPNKQKPKKPAPAREASPRAPADWRERFIESLAVLGVVKYAAQAAGVDETHPYAVRAREPEFALAWENALKCAVAKIEDTAYSRAISGLSDTLIIFILKKRKPEIYADRIIVAGDASNPLKVVVGAEELTDEQLLAIAAGHATAGGGGTAAEAEGQVEP